MNTERYHLVIDAENCDVSLLRDQSFIEETIKSIAGLCGMTIILGPISVVGIPENPGLTSFAIIDFSHISVHTFTKSREFCLDIFSCKPFSYDILYNYVKETFKLKDYQIHKVIVEYE